MATAKNNLFVDKINWLFCLFLDPTVENIVQLFELLASLVIAIRGHLWKGPQWTLLFQVHKSSRFKILQETIPRYVQQTTDWALLVSGAISNVAILGQE